MRWNFLSQNWIAMGMAYYLGWNIVRKIDLAETLRDFSMLYI